jgi:tRNA pseudouridine38-40 synthase
MQRCWKVTVQYDGTDYFGWQIQPDHLAVQEVIQKCLSCIYALPCKVSGSGRTDAGVHALGQVFSFHEPREISLNEQSFAKALNALLPQAIRILSADVVDDEFHARFSAVGKTYVYLIDRSERNNPFMRAFSWNRRHYFDLDVIQNVLGMLEGEHDFSAFTVNSGVPKKSSVRTIFKADLEKWQGYYLLSFTGNGFLYKMVRSLVGQVVECAAGLTPPDKIKELLATGCRTKAAQVAPAKGLFLGKVYYEQADLSTGLQASSADLLIERFFN